MARAPRSAAGGVPIFENSALPEPSGARGGGDISAPSGSGAAFLANAATSRTLADRLEALGERAQRRLDNRAVETFSEQGAAAGNADPSARMEGGGDLATQAFNRAASDAASRRLELTARERLGQLEQEHGADPAAFAAAAQSFRDGMAQGMRPDVAPRFALSFDALAGPAQLRVVERQRRQVADQALAGFNEVTPARLAAATRAAANPDEAAAAAREEQNHLADIARLGPREGFTLGGREFPPDPTRTDALSVVQMQARLSGFRREVTEARVMGQWRAAGSTPAWIDRWEAGATGAAGSGPRPAVDIGRIVDMVEGAESGGRNIPAARLADGTRPSSANGYHQFIDGTWLTVARRDPRTQGMSDAQVLALRGDRAFSREMAINHTQQDIIPALVARGVEPSALAIYAGWHFGGGTGAAVMNAPDAKPMREVLTPAAVAANPYLAEMNAGQWRERFARRFPPSVGPGVAIPEGMTPDEARRIANQMRAERSRIDGELRDQQQQAWLQVEPRLRENEASIALTGRPAHQITDDDILAAGRNPVAYRQAETFGIARFNAEQALSRASTPEATQAVMQDFMPGGRYFSADPAGSARVVQAAQARGQQVQGAALTQRVADLRAQAETGGQVESLTPEEGRAAGLRPEQIDAANRAIQQGADLWFARQRGAAMTPEQRAAAAAAQPIEGPDAAEARSRIQAMEEAGQMRDRAVAQDAAAYAMRFSAPARQVAAEVAGGNLARLPLLIMALRDQQAALGIPEAQRRDVPEAVSQAIAARLATRANDAERLSDLAPMLQALPDAGTRGALLDSLSAAGVPEPLVTAARLVPRIGMAASARIAGELGTDLRSLHVTPALTRDVTSTVHGVWTSGDRAGGIRERQAEVTGNAEFTAASVAGRQRLAQIVTVRSAHGDSASTSETRAAYEQLFGGVQAVDGQGVLALVPRGTDADRLAAGLRARLDALAQEIMPGADATTAATRARLREGVWTDGASPDRLVFYPAGSPLPLSRNGRPIEVTVAEALAAGAGPRVGTTLERARRRETYAPGDSRPESRRASPYILGADPASSPLYAPAPAEP